MDDIYDQVYVAHSKWSHGNEAIKNHYIFLLNLIAVFSFSNGKVLDKHQKEDQ